MNCFSKKSCASVFVAACLFLFAGHAFAQTEKQIAVIRSQVAAINKNAAQATRKTKMVDGISLEGTEAVGYFSGRNIVKITTKSYGETYNSAAEIYYRDGKPFFIYCKINHYESSIGQTNQPRIAGSEEQRVYFDGGEPIKIMVGTKILKTNDDDYGEIEKSLSELAGKLSAAFAV